MESIISQRLHQNPKILSPCIPDFSSSREKSRTICSVGRFFPFPHSKRQDVLIDAFIKNRKVFSGWKLVLAGGLTEQGGNEIFHMLKKRAVGYPIEFRVNIRYPELVRLYQTSSFYWHATGFGQDLASHPERAEHFGITTLEAMSSGCVPVVFRGGGQIDIITDGQNGLLWSSSEELVAGTESLIKDSGRWLRLSQGAKKTARKYSYEAFSERVRKVIL